MQKMREESAFHNYTKFLFSKRMGNLKTNGKMTFEKEYRILTKIEWGTSKLNRKG
jgi:hypothetical protein